MSTEVVESPIQSHFSGPHHMLTWLPEGDDVAAYHERRHALRHPDLLHLQLIQSLHVLRRVHHVPHHPHAAGFQHPHHLPQHPHSLRRRRRRLRPELLPHRVHEYSRHHHVEVTVAEGQRPRISGPATGEDNFSNYALDFKFEGGQMK